MGLMDGKVVLVTGAARGQGRSHALTLAREGADLVLLDAATQIKSVPYDLATPDDLATTAAEVEKLDRRALVFQADIRDQGALDDAMAGVMAEFNHLDAIVSNAGIWSINDFWKLTDEEWEDNLAVNVTGHWRTIKAATPHLMEQGSGSIVFTSSLNGIEAGPRYAHYCVAKAGLLALMRNVAVELGPHGIRSNAICPGPMDTTMNTWPAALDLMTGKEGGTMEERSVAGRYFSILPGRSMLSPSSTSNAVLFFASELSTDVTGVALPVDAGHLALPGLNSNPNMDDIEA